MAAGGGRLRPPRRRPDNSVYANFYPHGGGIWPYTDDTIELTLSDLPSETRRKVLGETMAKVYGQPMPDPIERMESDYTDEIWSRPWLKKAGEFTFDKSTMGLKI
ncbi:MAG: hypothetical protein F4185_05165 [Chloroflexi bacterium]|nr:hypothetical protein [Chloroflexota bacterium]